MKSPRLLTLLIPLSILIILETVVWQPNFFYYALSLIGVLIIYTAFRFKQAGNIGAWDAIRHFAVLIIFIFASAAYLVLLSNDLAVQVIIAAAALFSFFYLREFRNYLIIKLPNRKEIHDNVMAYCLLLAIFYIFSFSYGLAAFLETPEWLLALVTLPPLALIIYLNLSSFNVAKNLLYILTIIFTLIILELSWSLSFLPHNNNILGLIIALIYYLLVNQTNLYAKNKLTAQAVRKYLIFGLVSILLVLFTANWL